jgi:hypothetical protein
MVRPGRMSNRTMATELDRAMKTAVAHVNRSKPPLVLKTKPPEVAREPEATRVDMNRPDRSTSAAGGPPTGAMAARKADSVVKGADPGKAVPGDQKPRFRRRASQLESAADRFRIVAKEWRKAGLAWPMDVLPTSYIGDGYQIRPLAIGVGAELLRMTPIGSRGVIRNGLHLWVTSIRYLRAVDADGSMRHALDGTPVGEVSAEDRAFARGRIDEITAAGMTRRDAGSVDDGIRHSSPEHSRHGAR